MSVPVPHKIWPLDVYGAEERTDQVDGVEGKGEEEGEGEAERGGRRRARRQETFEYFVI